MIVVSNTSPLNYLVLLKKDHILPDLFGAVLIPPAVLTELSRKESPDAVRAWVGTAPPWLRIQTPRIVDTSLDLDGGEREAIALALEVKADRILLDDAKARRLATAKGLRVAGTLAVLVEAHERSLLDIKRTIEELRETTFFMDDALVNAILLRTSGS